MKILLFVAAVVFCLSGKAETKKLQIGEVVSRYNNFKVVSELIQVVFAFDKRTTSEDRKLIAQYLKSSGTTKLTRAALAKSHIVIEANPSIKIEPDLTTPGIFKINGKKVKILPGRSLRQTFAEIENAIYSKHSKLELIFGQKAFAGIPALVLGIYGIAALATGGICAAVGFGFGGSAKEVLELCSEAVLKWPKTLWDFIDGIRNGKDIEAGTCTGPSPQNKFGNLVQLKMKDQNASDIGVYFRVDPKTNLPKVYFLAYDPKANTYDQIHEKDEATLQYFVGGNVAAAKDFISMLETACKTGGTELLNKMIAETPEVKKSLSKLVKDWNSRSPAQTDSGKKLDSSLQAR